MNWLTLVELVDVGVYVRLKSLAALAVTLGVDASFKLRRRVLNTSIASRLSVASAVTLVVVEVKSLVTNVDSSRNKKVVVTKMV